MQARQKVTLLSQSLHKPQTLDQSSGPLHQLIKPRRNGLTNQSLQACSYLPLSLHLEPYLLLLNLLDEIQSLLVASLITLFSK